MKVYFVSYETFIAGDKAGSGHMFVSTNQTHFDAYRDAIERIKKEVEIKSDDLKINLVAFNRIDQ